MDAARRRKATARARRGVSAASALAALTALALAPSALAIAPHVQFQYTGSEQQYAVPGGVTLLGVGAQGGEGGGENESTHGAEVAGFLPVSGGQTLYVEVGAQGKYGSTESNFGGGGPGGTPPPGYCFDKNRNEPCAHTFASSGGGASDVRTTARSRPGSLASRVIVAAGGGGTGGGGWSSLSSCDTGPDGGSGAFAEPLPQGNAAAGPLPIKVASGLVVPGLYSAGFRGGNPGDRSRQDIDGFLDAGPGTNVGGLPGEASGCTEPKGPEETGTYFESLPGFAGTEGQGGSGGNAATLPPSKTRHCYEPGIENCANAGAGGGGGGGYFGGGGGSTGYNTCTLTKQECNVATNGQGGAGGSSFFANEVLWPQITGALSGIPSGTVAVVPVMEITSPANGANYAPGAAVNASWECLTGPSVNGVPQIGGCKGTKASGEAIDTSKGVHTFTVSAYTRVEGEEKLVSSTITYTAGEALGGGPGSNSSFSAAKSPRFNAKKGLLEFFFNVVDAGRFTWALTFKNADVGYADMLALSPWSEIGEVGPVAVPRASAARKCKAGFVKHRGKCVHVNVSFGSGSQNVSGGLVEIKVHASSKARKALKAGRTLHVGGTFKFQSSLGGSPAAHTVSAVVREPKRKHKK